MFCKISKPIRVILIVYIELIVCLIFYIKSLLLTHLFIYLDFVYHFSLPMDEHLIVPQCATRFDT